jgi:hypothetical protein
MPQGSSCRPVPDDWSTPIPPLASRRRAHKLLTAVVVPALLLLASCTSVGSDPEDPPLPGAEPGTAPAEGQPEAPPDTLFKPPVWEDTRYGLHMDLAFDTDPGHRSAVIDRAASLGVQVSRNSFLWDRMQRDPNTDIDWSEPDAVVDELAARGIEPMFTAYGSPEWASGAPEGAEDPRVHVPEGDAEFDTWVGQYAHLMYLAATRYRGKVTKWEVWNEQNSNHFWQPAPDIDRYVEFFQAVRAAILKGNPDAQVAPGGLAALAVTNGGSVTGFDWLQQMLDRGVRPDYVSIHPYAGEEQAPDDHRGRKNNFDDIERVHNILVEAGHEVPIWVTEWGWKTDEVSLDDQARYVTRSLEMIATDYPYVTVATYFINYDQADFTQGLYDANLNPRPAAEAFRSFVASRT